MNFLIGNFFVLTIAKPAIMVVSMKTRRDIMHPITAYPIGYPASLKIVKPDFVTGLSCRAICPDDVAEGGAL